MSKLLLGCLSTSFKKLSHVHHFNSRNFSSKVKFSFIEAASNEKIEVRGDIGKTVLEVAMEFNIDIEGACGGELACSTCHVIVQKSLFDKLTPKKEEEEDILDLAWGVTPT